VRQQAAKAGYSSVVTSALVSGKRYFRVTVPAGNDRKQADNLAERLKKSGFPVFVVGMR
jgi:cell division protein FtsN